MSFVSDQLRRLDAQLDGLQLDRVAHSEPTSPISLADIASAPAGHVISPSAHARRLQKIISHLEPSQRALSPTDLVSLLRKANISGAASEDKDQILSYESEVYDRDLEWLLLGKASIQAYAIVLNSLVQQTLPLSQDLWYWDEVLNSDMYTTLYMVQTGPSWLYQFSKEVLQEAQRRLSELRQMEIPTNFRASSDTRTEQPEEADEANEPVRRATASWSMSETVKRFHALVKNVISARTEIYRIGAISPWAHTRHGIRRKQENIRKLREMQASALGVLIGEGLSIDLQSDSHHGEWKSTVERAVLLMENVVRSVSSVEHTIEDFEEAVFQLDRPRLGSPEEDPTVSTLNISISSGSSRKIATAALSTQLQEILTRHLPAQATAARELVITHGRPSALARYWLPASAILLSSTTVLRILVNRRAALRTWLQELGATITDFYLNWVLDPVKKIIGTIRHSEDSEVALMSRKSLAADMDSLERMVVDFAVDNPEPSSQAAGLTPEQVRASVKEGDLTVVLKTYERDLRSPLRGAVRGELLRALLIQIQKTKVDVEVAISGIDRLLKSQELVFGFVGLTPGILVTIGVSRWLLSVAGRRGERGGRKTRERMMHTLRNVDRILTNSKGWRDHDGDGCLSYKEHGFLMCEVHVLREIGKSVLKRGVWTEFLGDLEELGEVRGGVRRQRLVVERLAWYVK